MLFRFALGEGRIALFGGVQAAFNIVRGDTSLVIVSIRIEHFYVFLDVTCALVLRIVICEAMASGLEQSLFGAKGGLDFILGACGDFLSDLAHPKRSVLRHFFWWENLWFVTRVRFECAWLCRGDCEVWPGLISNEPISVWTEWSADCALLLQGERRNVLGRWEQGPLFWRDLRWHLDLHRWRLLLWLLLLLLIHLLWYEIILYQILESL